MFIISFHHFKTILWPANAETWLNLNTYGTLSFLHQFSIKVDHLFIIKSWSETNYISRIIGVYFIEIGSEETYGDFAWKDDIDSKFLFSKLLVFIHIHVLYVC